MVNAPPKQPTTLERLVTDALHARSLGVDQTLLVDALDEARRRRKYYDLPMSWCDVTIDEESSFYSKPSMWNWQSRRAQLYIRRSEPYPTTLALVRAYLHDSLHYRTERIDIPGRSGTPRPRRAGVSLFLENGISFSPRDIESVDLPVRANLGIIMEGVRYIAPSLDTRRLSAFETDSTFQVCPCNVFLPHACAHCVKACHRALSVISFWGGRQPHELLGRFMTDMCESAPEEIGKLWDQHVGHAGAWYQTFVSRIYAGVDRTDTPYAYSLDEIAGICSQRIALDSPAWSTQ
jgi:hypothetical protein